MNEEWIELARKGMAAYNAGDIDGLLALFRDDVVATVPPEFANEGVYHGHDGFRRMLFHWHEAWETVEAEPLDFVAEGECVIVPVRQRMVGRESGLELETELAYYLHVRDGLLAEWRLFANAEDALRQARSQSAP